MVAKVRLVRQPLDVLPFDPVVLICALEAIE